jgi:hypothetical protein
MVKERNDNWITAEELVNQLPADPEYQKRRAESEARRKKRIEADREAARPVIQELQESGYNVTCCGDYLNSNYRLTPKEVEILIKWLPEIKSQDVQEIMVRALGGTKKPFDGKPLIDLFEKAGKYFKGDSLQWAIANIIYIGKVENINEWVVEALKNKKYGGARDMLCYAVAKMLPAEEAIPLLISIYDQLSITATAALGKVAKDGSVIDFLRKRQDEYSEILEQKQYRSSLHRNRLRTTVWGIDSAVRKIERRIAGIEEKRKNQVKKQKQEKCKPDNKFNQLSSFWRRIKHRIQLVETSMNFDGEMVRPFLQRISPFIDSGFGAQEIEAVVICTEDMEVDETQRFRFEIVYAGKPSELRIEIFMDDVDAPDISFYAEPELVEKIEAEMRKYCEELDI